MDENDPARKVFKMEISDVAPEFAFLGDRAFVVEKSHRDDRSKSATLVLRGKEFSARLDSEMGRVVVEVGPSTREQPSFESEWYALEDVLEFLESDSVTGRHPRPLSDLAAGLDARWAETHMLFADAEKLNQFRSAVQLVANAFVKRLHARRQTDG